MVLVVFEYIEIDGPVTLISISGIQDFLYDVYLLEYMA